MRGKGVRKRRGNEGSRGERRTDRETKSEGREAWVRWGHGAGIYCTTVVL